MQTKKQTNLLYHLIRIKTYTANENNAKVRSRLFTPSFTHRKTERQKLLNAQENKKLCKGKKKS